MDIASIPGYSLHSDENAVPFVPEKALACLPKRRVVVDQKV